MYNLSLTISVVSLLLVGGWFLQSKYFSAFHPFTLYLVFHAFVFVIRPIIGEFIGYEEIYRAFEFSPSLSDRVTVILASNLGFLTFAWFSLRAGRVAMTFKSDSYTNNERDQIKFIFIWVAAVCMPIGLYALIRTFGDVASGDNWRTVMDAGTGVFTNTTNNGWLVESQLMVASCTAIFAWLFRFKIWALLPLLGFIIIRAGTGGRGPFITALATVGLLWLYERRKRLPDWRAIVLIFVAVVVFRTIGDDRGTAIRNYFGKNETVVGTYVSKSRFLEGADFGNMEFFEYLVYAIPQRSHTYGYFTDNLQLFTEPIPRIWWHNKPIGAPFNRIFLFDYGRPTGMTRSLPGEGWFNLGWLGVIIWCGLCGSILGLIYRKWVEGPQNTLATLAYLVFLPTLITGYRDGLLTTIFHQNGFYLLPIALWYLLARKLGFLKASEMRLALARRRPLQPRDPAAAPPGDPVGQLPPAVQRRRAALQSAKS